MRCKPLKTDKDHKEATQSIKDFTSVAREKTRKNMCGICGSEKVYIRGKYPKTDNRLICSCCAYERLEQIHELSDKDYGQCYSMRKPIDQP